MKFILSLLALVVTLNTAFAMTPSSEEDKFVAVILLMDNGDEDQQIVATLYTTLMAAEKVAKLLDIEMIAEDEVNDDVFVFSLKSEKQKNLTMKLLDEEGYQVAAHRVLQIQDGNNYNALNVKSLEDGTYKFQLMDEEGREKTATLTIDRDEK